MNIPNMLGKSRFNRRLHKIADLFLTLFLCLGETWKQLNEKSVYVIDIYPIAGATIEPTRQLCMATSNLILMSQVLSLYRITPLNLYFHKITRRQ